MIKIFGKVRYHWQPDVAILIIYWSLSVIPIFVGLALMYESSRVPTLVLFSFFLRIITANPFTPIKVKISDIEKVEVTKTSITLYFKGQSRSRSFCMRKWPKKYFVNALALNEHFKGEVELVDNFTHIDYFEAYYGSQSKKS